MKMQYLIGALILALLLVPILLSSTVQNYMHSLTTPEEYETKDELPGISPAPGTQLQETAVEELSDSQDTKETETPLPAEKTPCRAATGGSCPAGQEGTYVQENGCMVLKCSPVSSTP